MGGSITDGARRDIEAAIAATTPLRRPSVRFVCVNVGPRYGMEYVSILADMIERNSSRLDSFAIECVTDRPEELPVGVGYIPANPTLPGWWQKVWLFSQAMPWATGDRIVYFDLDVAITGRLEDLVETPGILRDFGWPCLNSSVMVWDHGDHREIWDNFGHELMTSPGRVVPPELLPAGQINGGDQEWITEVDRSSSSAPWRILPSEWAVSYRMHATAWPPSGCKVVVFHGDPKPSEIASGWVPSVWKVGGFTSLPQMDGANVSYAGLLENVRVNSARDLPWFGQAPARKAVAVLVAGGPSMRDNLAEIQAHKRRGADIITVNNAWRFLAEHGITPTIHVMLDARPENAAFVADAPAGPQYLVASQCHPDVFEALADRDVTVWHNGFGQNDEMREALDPWWEGDNARPIVLVPGGGTVGLRALWLIALQGYRKVYIYGLDSSWRDGEHHAYAQTINDADQAIEVALADPETGLTKKYSAALWMVRQAEEFRWHWADLAKLGVTLFVHGTGLIPDIAKHLRKQDRAA